MRSLRTLVPLFLFLTFGFVAQLSLISTSSAGQATISSGSIQGTIQDPNGGVVAGAEVTVTSKSTGQKLKPEVNNNGAYSTAGISPGVYTVRAEAKGFKVTELEVTVQVGVISSGNITLEVGSESTTVTVEASAVTVNTDQVTVQGVLTSDQIKNLPINGRNFLDLAQLEPGVQIQDGGNFDPTKNGFASISFGGRYGRTARIEVDGLDISDETVGTTTQNVPLIAIKEFQVSQSSLDLSTELTSSGAVNISTNTGTNTFHGQGFFNWRGDSVSAKLSPDAATPFDRKQYGFGVGGPLLKDRLFFYGGWERTAQALQAAVALSEPFHDLGGSFDSPFFDNEFIGRLDYRFARGWSLFYRFSFEQNRNDSTYAPNTFQPFANVDHTPSHAVGFDFTTGKYTHSFRFGYMKFRNNIADAVAGSNIFNPAPQIEMAIGDDPFCLTAGADAFCSGPNFLAPQATFQRNIQIKYDGGVAFGKHQLRYGFGVNRINGGGFAKFLGLGPATNSALNQSTIDFANNSGPFPGGSGNPLNYPVQNVFLGNGQGFFTEKQAFSLPGGGQSDTRFQWYVGDAWRIRPNLVLTGGLRYVRDTGRADSDMAAIPCSATTLITCTGNLMDLWGPGLGSAVRQPNNNYGGNVGVAWDPFHNGKTVIRAGAGIYYENAPFNNVLFDRPARLSEGLFWGTAQACPGTSVTFPDGSVHDTSQICGQPIGSVAAALGDLQAAYQAAVRNAGPVSNGSFVGNTLAEGPNSTGDQLIAPVYRTPFSEQMNIGIQRELHRGTVLTVDYVRNVGLHSLLAHDLNHVGDSRYLNVNAAAAAISATNQSFNCATINCAIGKGATIVDYASNGLDSGDTYLFGLPASVLGLTPDTGAAFPGVNADIGQNNMLFPEGHSVYNALQTSLRSEMDKPMSGIKHLNLTVSYSLSRYKANAADSDFINNAVDNRNPNSYFGPNGLDRTHQLSVGGYMDLPLWTRVTFITHWYSGLPATLTLPSSGNPGLADVFINDMTGDGTAGDVLPGTNLGAFGRDITPSNLNKMITNFNSTYAGTLTPAGQALVSAGLMTADQLASLGGTIQPIALAPAHEVGLDSFFTFDLTLGWTFKPVRHWESFSFQPQVAFYNLFNRQNFDSPRSPMSGTLSGLPGTANGTTPGDRTNLIGLGSGVFAIGAPRSLEFGFRVYF